MASKTKQMKQNNKKYKSIFTLKEMGKGLINKSNITKYSRRHL